LQGGYQSHYSVIDTKTFTAPFPTQFDDFDDREKKRVVSDELVVFEGAQALPLFLVYYKARYHVIILPPCPTRRHLRRLRQNLKVGSLVDFGLFIVDLILSF